MRNGLKWTVLALLAAMAPGGAAADDLDRFMIGTGIFDVLQQEEESAGLDVEWRPGVRYFDVLAPFAGGFVTGDAAAYGYVGLGLELVLDERFVVMPFTGVGLYSEGDGKDLGYPIVFRSGLELGYRLGSGVQIGISGYHLSNGELGDKNPGAEVLQLQLSVPTSGLFD